MVEGVNFAFRIRDRPKPFQRVYAFLGGLERALRFLAIGGNGHIRIHGEKSALGARGLGQPRRGAE